MCTPCFELIRLQAPDIFLGFLSYEMGRPIVEGNPFLNQTHFFDPRGGLKHEIQLIREIRNQRYQIVIDFWNSNRAGIYGLLSGSKKRISYSSKRRFFYTEVVGNRPLVPPLYSALDKATLLEKAGFRPSADNWDHTKLSFTWSERDAAPVRLFFRENPELKASDLRIVISPTHRRSIRRWPIRNYALLADRIVKEWAAAVIWVWGPDEEDLIDEGMRAMRCSSWKAPELTFKELVPLFASCNLFIGNSNGPSHVAVAAGICSLQIHGPTHAAAWSPLSLIHRAVEVPVEEKSLRSIDSITVDEVWDRLQTMQNAVSGCSSMRTSL